MVNIVYSYKFNDCNMEMLLEANAVAYGWMAFLILQYLPIYMNSHSSGPSLQLLKYFLCILLKENLWTNLAGSVWKLLLRLET